jgi:hypothetical protein
MIQHWFKQVNGSINYLTVKSIKLEIRCERGGGRDWALGFALGMPFGFLPESAFSFAGIPTVGLNARAGVANWSKRLY